MLGKPIFLQHNLWLNVDVTHGIHTFKNRWRTLRVSRDEQHVLLRTNIAPLLELSTKFWETREKKESGITQFKRRQSTRQFHPKKFIQVSSKANKNQHSFIAHKIRDWNSLPKRKSKSVEAFKMAVMCHL